MANRHRDPGKQQFWQQHLLDHSVSGLSIRAYCRQHHLSEPSFHSWRRTLAQRTPSPQARIPAPPKESSPAAPAFLPLRLIDDSAPSAPLELVLGGGRAIRVGPGFSADALRQLLAVLEQRPC
jgi:hypothetical protein